MPPDLLKKRKKICAHFDNVQTVSLYDSLKRLTQVINPQAQRTTFAYDNAGRRTVKKLANYANPVQPPTRKGLRQIS